VGTAVGDPLRRAGFQTGSPEREQVSPGGYKRRERALAKQECGPRSFRVGRSGMVSRAARRLLPAAGKRALKGIFREARPPVDATRSRLEMLSLKRELGKRYGPDVVYTVHEEDEMLRFISDFWSWPHHVAPMRAPSDAMRTYLISGDVMIRDLETALGDQGRSLPQLDSFLEFACGYGRFTRFLVARLDPRKVRVSDINRSSVDFVRKTFGVSGFYSTESANGLDHSREYEVIFVASLFSHLAIEHWTEWLPRLYQMLAPGGLLIFSTHGTYARDVIYDPRQRDRLEAKADGFWFLPMNETGGRLAVEYYGSAFVTEEFVQREVTARGLGTVRRVYPAKLWGSQDLYVLEKPAAHV
jgi:SAM-dependent methyltransferase